MYIIANLGISEVRGLSLACPTLVKSKTPCGFPPVPLSMESNQPQSADLPFYSNGVLLARTLVRSTGQDWNVSGPCLWTLIGFGCTKLGMLIPK